MYIPISISAMDSTQNEIGTVQVIDHSSKFNYIPFSKATQTKETRAFKIFHKPILSIQSMCMMKR